VLQATAVEEIARNTVNVLQILAIKSEVQQYMTAIEGLIKVAHDQLKTWNDQIAAALKQGKKGLLTPVKLPDGVSLPIAELFNLELNESVHDFLHAIQISMVQVQAVTKLLQDKKASIGDLEDATTAARSAIGKAGRPFLSKLDEWNTKFPELKTEAGLDFNISGFNERIVAVTTGLTLSEATPESYWKLLWRQAHPEMMSSAPRAVEGDRPCCVVS